MSAQGWFPDPHGTYDLRYFDGRLWTQHVVRANRQEVDPRWRPPPAAGQHGRQSGVAVPHGSAGQWGEDRPTARGNGMAVAGLVLGIVGVVFGLIPVLFLIALACGTLAVIFGGVAWNNARHGANKKGMSIAGVVLGAVALVLGVAGIILIDDAVNDLEDDLDEAFDDAFGPASPNDYDIAIEECDRDELGYGTAAGTIRNQSAELASFAVTVNFVDAEGTRVADGFTFVNDLARGRSARWMVSTFSEVPEGADCLPIVE